MFVYWLDSNKCFHGFSIVVIQRISALLSGCVFLFCVHPNIQWVELLAWKRHIIVVVDRPNCMDFIYRTEFEGVKSCFGSCNAIFYCFFIRGLRGPYGKGLVGHCTSCHSLNPPPGYPQVWLFSNRKCTFPWRIPAPIASHMVPRVPANPRRKQHFDPFRRFCRTRVYNWQTGRPVTCVAIGHIICYVCDAA